MGSRNIDRIPAAVWRQRCEFVWEMAAEGWRVEAHCPVCHERRKLDLVEVAHKRGPEFSLWNVRAPCKGPRRCGGEVYFWARPPGYPAGFGLSENRITPKPPFAGARREGQ